MMELEAGYRLFTILWIAGSWMYLMLSSRVILFALCVLGGILSKDINDLFRSNT